MPPDDPGIKWVMDVLPRRVVQATHALLVASKEYRCPVTAAEVCVYDSTSLNVAATRSALLRAEGRGLAAHKSNIWIPTIKAYNLARYLEDYVLMMEDEEGR